MRQVYHGTNPLDPYAPEWARVALARNFRSKFRQGEPDQCWLWKGAAKTLRGQRYGVLYVSGKAVPARRVAYFLAHRRLPEGSIRQTCGNGLCVNPDHLTDAAPGEPPPPAPRRVSAPDCCKCGEQWSYTSGGRRVCKSCRYAALKSWREKNLEHARRLDREGKRRRRALKQQANHKEGGV